MIFQWKAFLFVLNSVNNCLTIGPSILEEPTNSPWDMRSYNFILIEWLLRKLTTKRIYLFLDYLLSCGERGDSYNVFWRNYMRRRNKRFQSKLNSSISLLFYFKYKIYYSLAFRTWINLVQTYQKVYTEEKTRNKFVKGLFTKLLLFFICIQLLLAISRIW